MNASLGAGKRGLQAIIKKEQVKNLTNAFTDSKKEMKWGENPRIRATKVEIFCWSRKIGTPVLSGFVRVEERQGRRGVVIPRASRVHRARQPSGSELGSTPPRRPPLERARRSSPPRGSPRPATPASESRHRYPSLHTAIRRRLIRGGERGRRRREGGPVTV